MGSFDVACSVSRITINGGDPVAYMPLKLYKYAYDPEAKNNTLIYSWCYYEPVCLPIFGEYFDYGFINQIEKNASTKAIEKHFDCPIETVVGANGHLPCPGMFVHRDIYQIMVDTQISESGNTDPAKSLIVNREEIDKSYDKFRNAMIELVNIPKQKKGEDWDMRFSDSTAKHKLFEAESDFPYREFKTFMKIYRPLIKRGWFKKEITDFLLFISGMNYANVHFFPAANGYQLGNHYGNRVVHQKALDILNDKIKEREEDD